MGPFGSASQLALRFGLDDLLGRCWGVDLMIWPEVEVSNASLNISEKS